MKYRLNLKIDVLPKSLNSKLITHWRTLHKENNTWDTIIACACSGQLPKQPVNRATIEITRHSYRMLDFDGLVGSMKPVVDSLVSCGVLKDDSWNVTGPWFIQQIFRPKKDGPLLDITITEY